MQTEQQHNGSGNATSKNCTRQPTKICFCDLSFSAQSLTIYTLKELEPQQAEAAAQIQQRCERNWLNFSEEQFRQWCACSK